MNKTVEKIVNLLFEDLEETEETRALREEVLDNCQSRFADMTARGLSEDDAISAVIESLRGMEDMLADYPRKADAFEKIHTVRPEGLLQRIDLSGVDSVRIRVRNMDVTVEEGDAFTLEKDNEEDQLSVTRSGGALVIEQVQAATAKTAEEEPETGMGILGSILRSVGRAIVRTVEGGGRLTLTVPGALRSAEIASASGDVTWDRVRADTLSVATTSGDADVTLPEDFPAASLTVTSASGDLTARGRVRTGSFKTLSGDIDLTVSGETLKASATSGDVDLTGDLDEAELTSVSGDVDWKTRARASREARMKSVSGDVSLCLPADTEAVDLSAKSTSGEVRTSGIRTGSGAPVRVIASSVSGDVVVEN